MHRKYDLFEKFPDGSSLWLACAFGQDAALFHLREFAKKSQNLFYAIDVSTGRIVSEALAGGRKELFAAARKPRRGTTPAAA